MTLLSMFAGLRAGCSALLLRQLPLCIAGLRGAGRLLLLLITLVMAASPCTEYLWSWDGFAHGGSDMELGTMTCIAVLCLALVLFASAQWFLRRWLAVGAAGVAALAQGASPLRARRLPGATAAGASPPLLCPMRI